MFSRVNKYIFWNAVVFFAYYIALSRSLALRARFLNLCSGFVVDFTGVVDLCSRVGGRSFGG